MPEITEFLMTDKTGKQIRDALLVIAGGEGADTTWARVRDNVEDGLGPSLYPVGTQFLTPHSVYGEIIWEVMGHDQVQSATGKAHTMTLMARDALTDHTIQFDSQEAAFVAENGLAAGTYHFTVTSQPWYADDVGKTYQFTIGSAVPAGGQIYIAGTYNATLNGKTITVYADGSSTTAIATGALSVGSGGTNLGALDIDGNHIQRIMLGSNNYKESAIRQFLNSAAAAGQYWEPKTKYDRPPSWMASLAGFARGFEQEFLNAVDTAIVKCSTNAIFESQDSSTPKNSAYTVSDRFFLASRMEVYGSSDIADGSVVMTMFNGAPNAKRIRRYNGAAKYYWLRTPYSSYAYDVRLVRVDGSLVDTNAFYAHALVPACII